SPPRVPTLRRRPLLQRPRSRPAIRRLRSRAIAAPISSSSAAKSRPAATPPWSAWQRMRPACRRVARRQSPPPRVAAVRRPLRQLPRRLDKTSFGGGSGLPQQNKTRNCFNGDEAETLVGALYLRSADHGHERICGRTERGSAGGRQIRLPL